MLPIRTHEGRFYIGDIEVDLTPVFVGLSMTLEFTRKLPSIENLLLEIVSEGYKKGRNLLESNSYRCLIYSESIIPPQEVMDGIVPGRGERKVIFDFYKAMPKPEERVSPSS